MTLLGFVSVELCRLGWHRSSKRTARLSGRPLAFRCHRCGRVI